MHRRVDYLVIRLANSLYRLNDDFRVDHIEPTSGEQNVAHGSENVENFRKAVELRFAAGRFLGKRRCNHSRKFLMVLNQSSNQPIVPRSASATGIRGNLPQLSEGFGSISKCLLLDISC